MDVAPRCPRQPRPRQATERPRPISRPLPYRRAVWWPAPLCRRSLQQRGRDAAGRHVAMSSNEWRSIGNAVEWLSSSGQGAPSTISIIDSVSCDASSMVHTMIACAFLRDPTSVVYLVSLARPVAEFVAIARRMGYDLAGKGVQKKFYATDCYGQPAAAGGGRHHAVDLLAAAPAAAIEEIRRFAEECRARSCAATGSLTIIVDGLSTLLSLGWSLGDCCRLIQALEGVTEHITMRTCKSVGGGILARWLVNRSNAVIVYNPIASGASRTAHGELVIVAGGKGLAPQGSCALSNSRALVFLYRTGEGTILVQEKRCALPALVDLV